MNDSVNHPSHYTSHPTGIECVTITEHMGFLLGNAIKYIWRADLKHDAIEDLKKARWYIDREIAKREKAAQPKTKGIFVDVKVDTGAMQKIIDKALDEALRGNKQTIQSGWRQMQTNRSKVPHWVFFERQVISSKAPFAQVKGSREGQKYLRLYTVNLERFLDKKIYAAIPKAKSPPKRK